MKLYRYILFWCLGLLLVTTPEMLHACGSSNMDSAVKSCCKQGKGKKAAKECSCCKKKSKKDNKSCEGDCKNSCHCTSVVSFTTIIGSSFNQEASVSFYNIKNTHNNFPSHFLSFDFASIWVPPKINSLTV